MAELKTKLNDASVVDFLNSVEDDKKRQDSFKILELMQEVTGEEPKMWGTSIVGFGSYHFKYTSGKEGDWMATGFSPRKQNLTLYIMDGFEHYDDLLGKLGKHSTGKSCLYVKKTEDIDMDVLRKLVKLSTEHVSNTAQYEVIYYIIPACGHLATKNQARYNPRA
ncbi:MAG: DUF1801 domain-containing protein [Anaerolineales bacterium]|nr:DUF1801 domain-containing protein [Chloroflexota bacterium]MBL6982105.1 DUF1801 domain-containing protein [Anaerolineales bacterium]